MYSLFVSFVAYYVRTTELAQTERDLEEFKKGPGRKLHRILQLMRWNPMSDSWLAEMWLRYVRTGDFVCVSRSSIQFFSR